MVMWNFPSGGGMMLRVQLGETASSPGLLVTVKTLVTITSVGCMVSVASLVLAWLIEKKRMDSALAV